MCVQGAGGPRGRFISKPQEGHGAQQRAPRGLNPGSLTEGGRDSPEGRTVPFAPSQPRDWFSAALQDHEGAAQEEEQGDQESWTGAVGGGGGATWGGVVRRGSFPGLCVVWKMASQTSAPP